MGTKVRAAEWRRAPIVLAIAALLLAACSTNSGGSTSASASASASGSSAAASASASGSAAASAEQYSIEVSDSSVGKILVDQDGKTVYRFTPDSAGTSTCTGGCLDNWPPVTIDAGESVTAGDGVTGAVSTMTRDDGKTQVTVGGFPVYFFAGDSSAGDVNGQGVGGKWFVMTADGEMQQ